MTQGAKQTNKLVIRGQTESKQATMDQKGARMIEGDEASYAGFKGFNGHVLTGFAATEKINC